MPEAELETFIARVDRLIVDRPTMSACQAQDLAIHELTDADVTAIGARRADIEQMIRYVYNDSRLGFLRHAEQCGNA